MLTLGSPVMTTSNGTLTAAIRYAGRGWLVLPIHSVLDGLCGCGNAQCDSPGKHPRTTHGLSDATTDPITVRAWWDQWPDANLAVCTGPTSGIVAVDVDSYKGVTDEAVDALELPQTLSATTGGGGQHFLFRHPGVYVKCNNDGKLGTGIDFKGDGGYIIVPPSHHASGGDYYWDVLNEEKLDEIAALPRSVIDILSTPPPQAAGPVVDGADGDEIHEGTRDCTLASLAGSMRNRGFAAEEIEAALVTVNDRRCMPPLPRDQVAKIAQSIGRYEAPSIVGDQRPGEPFPTSALPWVLQQLVERGSHALSVDASMIALPMLSVIAGSIGASRRIALWDSWKEPAVLWCVVVARSGQQKSPSFDLALEPLRKRESRAAVDHETLLLDGRDEQAFFDVEFTAWKKDPKRSNSPPQEPIVPARRRYLTGDTTIEALASILHDSPRGVLVGRDELSGWFASLNAYRQGNKGGDESHYCEMHRGGPIIVDRKGGLRTINVPSACVSITGTVQPKILQQCLRPEHLYSGLAARFLFAMPRHRPRTWPDQVSLETEAAGYDSIIGALLDLELVDGQPIDIPLDGNALRIFKEYFLENAARIDASSDRGDDAFVAALTKIEALCPRLALIIHLAQVADGSADPSAIGGDSMIAGANIANWFAGECRRVYCMLRDTEASGLVRQIRAMGGSVSPRQLTAHDRRLRTVQQAAELLDGLVGSGLATKSIEPSGGGPRVVYTLTPYREHQA